MSSKMVQLDMFINSENEEKAKEDAKFKDNTIRGIRGLFARYNELEFKMLDISEQLEKITKHLEAK